MHAHIFMVDKIPQCKSHSNTPPHPTPTPTPHSPPNAPEPIPILIIPKLNSGRDRNKVFQFLNFWTTNPEYENLYNENWPTQPDLNFILKADNLKIHLQKWYNQHYKNLDHQICVLQHEMSKEYNALSHHCPNSNVTSIIDLNLQ